MHCPVCPSDDTKVIDSRAAEEGASIRRRRQCPLCGFRFTTRERLEEAPLMVTKRSGSRVPFDRAKVIAGVSAATKGRPVEAAVIEALADRVEENLRVIGSEVTSTHVGHAVLEQLRDIDEVAYLRFASVYKNFDQAADFRRELALLEKN
ncbi:MAG: transcriptional repressor NrdR [Ilumatobacteraceae bacterium]|nr:transcriptional repressor NrdR [Ilumatobacteraceae bacterium]MBU6242048.1 transcriptional regulator NrdR [Acidobacteriota bacterium]